MMPDYARAMVGKGFDFVTLGTDLRMFNAEVAARGRVSRPVNAAWASSCGVAQAARTSRSPCSGDSSSRLAEGCGAH